MTPSPLRDAKIVHSDETLGWFVSAVEKNDDAKSLLVSDPELIKSLTKTQN